MAEQVALKTGCTVAEPVWYGSHPYNHLGMPGTVVVPEDAFLANLRAVIAGFWNTGFRKQILLNGHGQEEVIPLALHQWAKKYQVPCVLISLHWPTVIHDYLKDKAHGGPFETPSNTPVKSKRPTRWPCSPNSCTWSWPWIPSRKAFCRRATWTRAAKCTTLPSKGTSTWGWAGTEVLVYPEGVIGRPTLANAEKPSRALRLLMDYMVKLIGDIMTRFPAGQLPPLKK